MTFPHDPQFRFPKLTQRDVDSGRVYHVDEGPDAGLVLPSITRILGHKEKPFLQEWIKKVGTEEAEHTRVKSQNRGNTLHKLAEDYLQNKPIVAPWPHVQELWSTLRQWIDTHITCVYCQETAVYSRSLNVAGRLDLLADISGSLGVGDFKNALKPK